MIYRLPEKINKEVFYHQILPDLTKRYAHLKKGDITAVSFVQTEVITSNALPLLAGMLTLLQYKSGNPVHLELAYNPRLHAFLDAIGFFRELAKHQIIEYHEDDIGDIAIYDYNSTNKVLTYTPFIYYEEINREEKEEIRDKYAERIRYDLCYTSIFNYETTPINNDEDWDTTIVATTELLVNAIIYSRSISYAYIQSGMEFTKNKRGYIISVVDAGKGYYKALGEKIMHGGGYTEEQRTIFYRHAQKIGIDVVKEINFLSIMEALYFSQTQPREMNLFKLKNRLAISNANFRIHQKNREVIFTADGCRNCMDRDTLHCVECVWKRRNWRNSPIRKYPVAMAGVHIEVEFIREK